MGLGKLCLLTIDSPPLCPLPPHTTIVLLPLHVPPPMALARTHLGAVLLLLWLRGRCGI